jgi:hypothetical protein
MKSITLKDGVTAYVSIKELSEEKVVYKVRFRKQRLIPFLSKDYGIYLFSVAKTDKPYIDTTFDMEYIDKRFFINESPDGFNIKEAVYKLFEDTVNKLITDFENKDNAQAEFLNKMIQ